MIVSSRSHMLSQRCAAQCRIGLSSPDRHCATGNVIRALAWTKHSGFIGGVHVREVSAGENVTPQETDAHEKPASHSSSHPDRRFCEWIDRVFLRPRVFERHRTWQA